MKALNSLPMVLISIGNGGFTLTGAS